MDEIPDVLNVYDQDHVSELAAWNFVIMLVGGGRNFHRSRVIVKLLVD